MQRIAWSVAGAHHVAERCPQARLLVAQQAGGHVRVRLVHNRELRKETRVVFLMEDYKIYAIVRWFRDEH